MPFFGVTVIVTLHVPVRSPMSCGDSKRHINRDAFATETLTLEFRAAFNFVRFTSAAMSIVPDDADVAGTLYKSVPATFESVDEADVTGMLYKSVPATFESVDEARSVSSVTAGASEVDVDVDVEELGKLLRDRANKLDMAMSAISKLEMMSIPFRRNAVAA